MEEKVKKNRSLIIAIVIVIAVIGLSYLGVVIYANYLAKLYETKTNELIPAAVEYVKSNKEYIDENIFHKLDKHEKVTDGLVYVNKNQEVALAIIYDDAVCYVKKYDSDKLIDILTPAVCKGYLLLHINDYKDDIDINPDLDNDTENDNSTDNDDEYINTVAFDISFDKGNKVSDLKLSVKANGKSVTNYSYDYLQIYKVDDDFNACEISSTHTKLNNNYVLKSNEKYVIEIKELKVEGKKIDIPPVTEMVFVNGTAIEKLEKYCVGSAYDDGRSLSFRFVLPTIY